MFAQPVLNRRLNSEGGESMSPTHVDLTPIGPKRQAVKADEFEVVPPLSSSRICSMITRVLTMSDA